MKKIYVLLSVILLTRLTSFAASYQISLPLVTNLQVVGLGSYQAYGEFYSATFDAVSGFTVNVQIDNGPIMSGVVDTFLMDVSLVEEGSALFAYPFPLTFTSTGQHTIKSWVSLVDSLYANTIAANDTDTQVINVVNSLPEKKVLVEYYSECGCSVCADFILPYIKEIMTSPYLKDAVFMDAIADYYNVTSGVDTLITNLSILGYPSFVFDRTPEPLMNYGQLAWGGTDLEIMGYDYPIYLDGLNTSPEGVSISNVQFDSTTRDLSFDATTTFYDNSTDSIALVLYLTEDSVMAWQYTAVEGDSFIHRFVFRGAVGNAMGIPGSLPYSASEGATYTYHATYNNLYPTFNIYNMYIVGAIVHTDPVDTFDRHVYNSTSIRIIDNRVATGISAENEQAANISIYPNPTSRYAHISMNGLPADKKLSLYNMVGARVGEYALGKDASNFTIDLYNLPAGEYIVKVLSADNTYTGSFIKN